MEHSLVYLVTVDGKQMHLVYKCPKKGAVFVPMVKGLDIPLVKSKKCLKQEQEDRQQSLL